MVVTPNHVASIAIFFFLFFSSSSSNCVFVLATSSHRRNCTPSYCGSLRNISYPLRLSSDPKECGEIELSCEGKDTFLYIDHNKYFVTGVDYANHTLSLLYVGLAKVAGLCHLPNPPFVSDEGTYDRRFGLSYALANLMNCSQRIQSSDNTDIVPLPCFSSNNSSAVYAALGGSTISELGMSCSFLASFPIEGSFVSGTLIRSETDLFQHAQKGFPAVWLTDQRPKTTTICWRNTIESYNKVTFFSIVFFPIVFEARFLNCLLGYVCENGSTRACLALVLLYLMQYALIALVVLSRFIFVPTTIFVFLGHKFWKTRREVDNVEKFLQAQQAISPARRYAYSDLIAMTNNFEEKLGQGGFGTVFKGRLQGVIPVAVKMLGGSKLNGEEFISEVSTIGRIHHVNIMRLMGFCSEGSKRALIYEYMPNGSLDKYIFGSSSLAIEKLNEIALGAARGIDYLHRGCQLQILHFDIKPHNILLDSNFVPKVSDFGLAKLYPKDHSRVSVSVARGTIGYIAPELVSRSFGIVSHKSDVYSFGMLLMDMAGKRRNGDFDAAASSQDYFPSWIYDKLLEQEGDEPVGITEVGEIERKLWKVGLWCIQMKSSDRPSMSKVVEMLEGKANDIQMPPRPFFSSSEQSSTSHPSMPTSTSVELSIISELDNLS